VRFIIGTCEKFRACTLKVSESEGKGKHKDHTVVYFFYFPFCDH